MIKNTLILIFLFSFYSYSQVQSKQTIFLNEELEQIDNITYAEQVLKSIYKEVIITKDSVIIKRLQKTYDFGSFNETELSQVHNILKKHLNIKDFDKNIILILKDSLLGYTHYANAIQRRNKLDKTDLISKKDYLKRMKNYDSKQKKCKKFATKNNAIPIYTYLKDSDYTFKPKHHTNYKIPDIIKSVFFKNVKNGHIILKPNGQYFYYNRLTEHLLKKMLNSDWTEYIANFKRVKENPKAYSLDFVETMYIEQEKEMEKIAYRRFKQKRKEQERKKSSNFNKKISVRLNIPNCYTNASY
jgi:hypothetical protein